MAVIVTGTDGQLGDNPLAPANVLYTCPTSKQAIVRSITVCNRDAGVVNIVLYLYRTGPRYIGKSMTAGQWALAAGEVWTTEVVYCLKAGETIRGDADVATAVDYVISVFEDTVP